MLRGMSEIRGFFRTNRTPIYFISPTSFNLLGIDRWVRGFQYVNYFDSFNGTHPQVFVPAERPYREFESIEDINNYLLSHKEVLDRIGDKGGLALFVFLDEETERLAADAGLKVALPSAALRHRLDSKIVTTQLGNEAGVPSVPNRIGRASSYEELQVLAGELGTDLVVQTPVRRLRQDDVLHPRRARLQRRGEGPRRRGAEGDEADQLPRGGGRGRHHPPRHGRRAGHARPHRLPGADARTRAAGAATTSSPTRCPPSTASAPAS